MILWISDDVERDGPLLGHLIRVNLEPRPVSPGQALTGWADLFPDVMVISLHAPGADEVGLARRLRRETVVPVFMLTSARTESHLLDAYDTGLDEVIARLASPPLLAAKIRAWLRRSGAMPLEALAVVQAGGLRLEPRRRSAIKPDGTVVRLTPLELRLLYFLMSRPGRELSAEEILARIWRSGGDKDSLKTTIRRLRLKIEPDSDRPRYILTVPGGYMFMPQSDASRPNVFENRVSPPRR